MTDPTTPTNQRALLDVLQALPAVAPPDDVWAQIERRTRPVTQRHGVRRWWLAAAAMVVVSATAGIVMFERSTARAAAGGIPALVAQSQRLERRVGLQRAQSTDEWDASRRALVYRIADLDRELAPLSIDPARDPVRAEMLWRQRIALMESLSEIDRADVWQSRRALAF
jgi:hypothetical protein